MKMNITAAQCRMARALLDWTRPNLNKASKVGVSTISDFENEKTDREISESTKVALWSAFNQERICFLERDGVCWKDEK